MERELKRMLNEEFNDDMVHFSKFLQKHEIREQFRYQKLVNRRYNNCASKSNANAEEVIKISSDTFKGNLENTLSSIDKSTPSERAFRRTRRVLNNREMFF